MESRSLSQDIQKSAPHLWLIWSITATFLLSALLWSSPENRRFAFSTADQIPLASINVHLPKWKVGGSIDVSVSCNNPAKIKVINRWNQLEFDSSEWSTIFPHDKLIADARWNIRNVLTYTVTVIQDCKDGQSLIDLQNITIYK